VCTIRWDDDDDDDDDKGEWEGRVRSRGEDGRGAIGGRKFPCTLTTSLVLFDRPPPACSYWSAFAAVAVFSGIHHRRRYNFLSTPIISYPSATESTSLKSRTITFLNRIWYYNFFSSDFKEFYTANRFTPWLGGRGNQTYGRVTSVTYTL